MKSPYCYVYVFETPCWFDRSKRLIKVGVSHDYFQRIRAVKRTILRPVSLVHENIFYTCDARHTEIYTHAVQRKLNFKLSPHYEESFGKEWFVLTDDLVNELMRDIDIARYVFDNSISGILLGDVMGKARMGKEWEGKIK